MPKTQVAQGAFIHQLKIHALTKLLDVFYRKYVSQYVPHTNLIMVLVINPSCSCTKTTVDIEPKEVIYTKERQCELLKKEKNRKRPSSCHNYHPQVNALILQVWSL